MIPFHTIIPAGTGAATVYVPMPANMTMLGASATPSTASGCTSTITFTSGSTDVGTLVVSSAQAAATVTNATMSATLATRKTLLTKAIPLKVTVDARTNSCSIFITIYMDEFALQAE